MKQTKMLFLVMYGLLLQEPVEGSFKCEPGKEPGLDLAVMKYGNCMCHPYDPDVLYCPKHIKDKETVSVRIRRGVNMEVECGDDVDGENLQDLLVSLNISDSYTSSHISSVAFINCPPTMLPLSLLVDKIGLKHINKVSVKCKNGGNFQCHEFHNLFSFQLTNMTNIKTLQFETFGPYNANDGIKPVTLDRMSFEGVPNLQLLTIKNVYSIFRIDSETFQVIPRLKHLTLYNCNLTHLPKDTFKNLTSLIQLNLGENKILSLPSEIFADLKLLSKLLLQNNLLSTLPSGVFDSLEYLKFLKLNGNQLVSLPGQLFTNNKKLAKFILRDNIGEIKLDPQLFQNSHLKSIELFNCALQNIPEGLLDGNTNLQKFIVQSAKLQNLPVNLFKDTKMLTKIDFSDNNLTQINPELFKNLDKLQELKLIQNQLTQLSKISFEGLTSLKTVKLTRNQISHLDPDTFLSQSRSLTHLAVGGNQLTTALFTTHLHNLKALDLSYNLLSAIQPDWRNSKPYLVKINLAGNQIGPVLQLEDVTFKKVIGEVQLNLSENNIQQILILERNKTQSTPQTQNDPKTRVKIIIDKNPLTCDCLLTNIKDNKHDPGKENIRITWDTLSCSNKSAHTLIGQNVDLLNPHDLNCKFPSTLFTTNCLPPCQCFLNRFQKQILVNCANNGLTEIPTKLPFISHEATSIRLNLQNNSLTELRQLTTVSNFDKIAQLNISHNHFIFLDSSYLPPHLTHLDFSHNSITLLTNNTLSALSNLTLLSLGHNPYECSCHLLDLYNFLLSNRRKVQDLNQVHSQCRLHLSLVPIEHLHTYCADPAIVFIASAGVISLLMVLFTIIFVVILCCFKEKLLIWLYSKAWADHLFVEDVREKEKPYDAFVSYSPLDTEFVEGVLLPGLETPPKNCNKFKCCVHTRDGEIGSIISEQISGMVESSRRTVVVLSSNYVRSEWAKHEFKAAQGGGHTNIIVIKLGDLPDTEDMEEDLTKYLQLTTYLDAEDPWFWKKLRYALPHRRRSQGERRKRRETGKVELISENSWDSQVVKKL